MAPLSLIIRFSLPIPDLPLTVPSPSTTTAQSLNAQIRPHLPPQYSSYPLRLIAAGALLPPQVPLSSCLRLPSPTISPSSSSKPSPSPTPPSQTPPLYIHCAPTTTATPLSPSALHAEKTPYLAPLNPSSSSASAAHLPVQQQQQPQAPLGFDRLLSAGLTTAEIASLRSQFLAQTQHMHTPDTMPSAAELRVLEERWLDDSSPGGGGGGGSVGGGAGDGDEGEVGGLEDMLWGNVMGFFWAIGGLIWLTREEGVWSRRRQVGVVTGVLVNIAFGVFRVTG